MSANQPGIPRTKFPGPANPGGRPHPDPEDLVLFAMQLFPAEEAASIATHLRQCADCRAELGRIQGDLATFASTTDLHSPAESSRHRLMLQVAREKKNVSAAQSQRQPQQQAQPQPAPPLASFGRTASILTMEDRQAKRSTGQIILANAGWAIAACLAVAALLLFKGREDLRAALASQTGQIQRLNTDAASAHQLMDALTDPKAIRVTLTTRPQPKAAPIAGVTYNAEKGSLVFLASNLDPLRTYKTYELWVIPSNGSAPIPAGTFHPDDQGNASVIMPDLPKGVSAKAFGVTIEDEGGAQTPTMPIIMSGS